uniref:RNA 2'-phosphotransferase n=1 Tax=Flavobacterium sp. TaxID=239 RepID=UPI0040499E1C
MKSEKEINHLSKFLSLILRHKPETIGLTLEENGYVNTELLLEKCNEHGVSIDFETLKYVVETNNKKRFGFSEDFLKIRANQGHSTAIDLGLTPVQPPQILYHGTAEANKNSILQQGIEKRNRHHVHLSQDKETAHNVGKRHGKPIIFEVQASKMFEDGYAFYQSENGVWLTENVPARYLLLRP